MKLLLITCIQEYEKNVKEILSHSGVKSYSYQRVKGYSNGDGKNKWFVSEEIFMNSLLFTVFIDDDCMEDIFGRVNKFNAGRAVKSKIHMACLDVNHSI